MTMKFLIFVANLTLLLSFPESEGVLQNKMFIIGFKNHDYVRHVLPKDNWYVLEDVITMHIKCEDVLNSIWIFPENYSDTSNKPPFGMIHEKYEALSIGRLILYYNNNPEVIPAFCCQHDENMATYISYNTGDNRAIAFRKTSTRIDDTTITPGKPDHSYSYEDAITLIFGYIYYGITYDDLRKAVKPTLYCLSLFWKLSRYEIQSYEAHTIINKQSGNTIHCESFLFAEVQHGYFLSYDIELHVNVATENFELILKGNDRLHLVTTGYVTDLLINVTRL